jgi:hypothetical protein
MEKINWANRVRNGGIIHGVREERNIVRKIMRESN